MKRCIQIGAGVVMLLLMHVPLGEAAVHRDFSVYQRDIIDRQPFGEPPPVPVKLPPPVVKKAPTPTVLRDIVLVAITDDADAGVKVGFTNRRTKRYYYMRVGDPAEDGISVVEAYIEDDKAVLEYDGHRETLRLPGAAASVAHAPLSPALAAAGGRAAAGAAAPRIRSYRDRLQDRRDEILAARRKADKERHKGVTREEFQQHLNAYQMDLIRNQGQLGPPLPIPLTQEMDAQLVQEGVLPPQK